MPRKLRVEYAGAIYHVMNRAWDRLVAGLVLGTEAFAQRLRQQMTGNPREQKQIQRMTRPATL